MQIMDAPAEPAVSLEVQLAVAAAQAPAASLLERAARAALAGQRERAEVTVRIVGKRESRDLNRRYRQQDKATNVLSFPAHDLAAIAPDFLGDIAICAPLVRSEARAQGKPPAAHWSHLVVHGVLHLLGYNHVEDTDAMTMEERERAILEGLGYPDPYRIWAPP